MKEFACRKCGSEMLFIKDNGTQVGLYCSDCGAWQKWLGKDEQRLAEQWIEYINLNKKVCKSSKQQIQEMIDYLDTLFELGSKYKNVTLEQFYNELKDSLKNWKDVVI
jgi:hypothetical protein